MDKPDWRTSHELGRLAHQCRRYVTALRLGEPTERLDRDRAAQAEHYAMAAMTQRMLEFQVKQVLMSAGVPIVAFVSYYNFARTVARVRKGRSHEEFMLEVWAAMMRWLARGFSRTVLERILREVFTLEPPALPGEEPKGP